MYVFYDASGKILSAVQASSSEITPPDNDGTPLYLDDAEYATVYNDLANYIIQNGTPVYSPIVPSPPEPQPPSIEERTTALEDAITVLMGL